MIVRRRRARRHTQYSVGAWRDVSDGYIKTSSSPDLRTLNRYQGHQMCRTTGPQENKIKPLSRSGGLRILPRGLSMWRSETRAQLWSDWRLARRVLSMYPRSFLSRSAKHVGIPRGKYGGVRNICIILRRADKRATGSGDRQ